MLWIFGDNVEDRFGHVRYLLFYVICGLGAGGLHLVTHPFSEQATVGASGAIAGVMGAYLVMFPYARVLAIVPIVFVYAVPVPAALFLGLWFLMQFWSGTLSLAGRGGQTGGGIAWWAHVGGFLIGLYFGRKARRKKQVGT